MILSYNKSDKLALDYFLKSLKITEEINYKIGTAKCLIACGLSYAAIGNISFATDCYLRARNISEELNDISLVIKSIGNLAVVYTGKGEYEKALEGYREILRFLEKKDDKNVRSVTFINIGEISKYQGNYPRALEYYHKALKIKEEANEEPGISLSFINIGSIYTLQGEYDKALEYEHRALEIAEKLKDKRLISNCYEEIGTVYLQTKKPEALEYFQKALKIVVELSYQTPVIRVLSKIGDYYRAQGDFNEALVNYSSALKISEELGRKRTICETGIKIGNIYLLKKDYVQALKYCQKSLEIANELKLLDNQKDLHKLLSEIYAAKSDFKNALLHQKQYQLFKDSIFGEKNIMKIAELEITYKFEKEKQAVELQNQRDDALQSAKVKQQRIVIISLIAGFLLMALLVVLLVWYSRIKAKTNNLLTRQKREIEELNEEYLVVNEALLATNEELVVAKNHIEKNEERLRLLIKNSNDIFVMVNDNGEQFFISDAAKNLTGYEVEELFGSIENVIYPEDQDIVKQHWERVLSNKDSADSIQYRHKHKEKGYVWFETVAQNFLDHSAIKAVVANIRDITERKKAEQAIKDIEAEKARLMALEIERIGHELESNQKAITAASLKLLQNSERDAQTIGRLEDIEKNTDPTGKKKISTLISDYKRISYNSNWDEFEILFEKVHSSFYEKLNELYPSLTANERKICAFLKLNMSNKDIAQITFQSDEALKKARLRLRQKLEIERETNLVTFLQNI
jgi:PAS domain S-box-containing protein